MRSFVAGTALAAALFASVSAQAERRIFIIANDADAYGVDRCLASGASCGTAVANAYCKARDFALARSFRKIERDEVTGAVPSNGANCHGSSCDEFVAIECSR
jgi:hypothetical protein